MVTQDGVGGVVKTTLAPVVAGAVAEPLPGGLIVEPAGLLGAGALLPVIAAVLDVPAGHVRVGRGARAMPDRPALATGPRRLRVLDGAPEPATLVEAAPTQVRLAPAGHRRGCDHQTSATDRGPAWLVPSAALENIVDPGAALHVARDGPAFAWHLGDASPDAFAGVLTVATAQAAVSPAVAGWP